MMKLLRQKKKTKVFHWIASRIWLKQNAQADEQELFPNGAVKIFSKLDGHYSDFCTI